MGVAEAIAFAEAQIGKPYGWATEGPNTFDCSGLVQASCKAGGVSVGRTTYEQILEGTPVTRDQLLPGDLVFPDADHVQLYVGNNQVIEAPHSGAFVRQVAVYGVWQARRVFSGESANVQTGFVQTGIPGLTGAQVLIDKVNIVAGRLVSAGFWKRIGIGGLGIFVLLLGVAFINRKRLETAVKTGNDKTSEGPVV